MLTKITNTFVKKICKRIAQTAVSGFNFEKLIFTAGQILKKWNAN